MRRVFLFLGLCSALAACTARAPTGSQCALNSDCPSQYCLSGQCRVQCRTDVDCRSNTQLTGVCLHPEDAGVCALPADDASAPEASAPDAGPPPGTCMAPTPLSFVNNRIEFTGNFNTALPPASGFVVEQLCMADPARILVYRFTVQAPAPAMLESTLVAMAPAGVTPSRTSISIRTADPTCSRFNNNPCASGPAYAHNIRYNQDPNTYDLVLMAGTEPADFPFTFTMVRTN